MSATTSAVSDTDVSSATIRAIILRHTLLSYGVQNGHPGDNDQPGRRNRHRLKEIRTSRLHRTPPVAAMSSAASLAPSDEPVDRRC
ncbi:DUF1345 domain-containing protein [Nocardia australiensis]|uniref:DUF1345 domain-containing protein n=1 Tax=Nocardia australiensis TaxID=2887191 RepID=UPI001D15D395|nr:DUF1345 domain-containing protein [Nocardia australiensis]